MAGKFKKEIEIKEDYYDGGAIVLRRPRAQEINDFQKEAYPTGKKGYLREDRNTVAARIKYFDLLFVKVTGFLDDDDQPLPENAVDQIPEDEKNHIVTTYIEAREGLDSKN